MKRNELLVFKSRNLLMQRIADHVVHGYTHYCSGAISVEGCQKLATKFNLLYQVSADRNERARRKRANLGNAALLLYYDNNAVRWWMMVTDPQCGEHLAHHRENLCDAMSKKGRCQIDGYELVKLARKGAEGTKLTWRMSAATYQNWREYIIDTVRACSTTAMHRMLYQLWSVPGFSGIRSQVGHLVALYRAELRRSGKKDAPQPPKRLPYLRRLKTQGISLAQLSMLAKATDSNGNNTCDASNL